MYYCVTVMKTPSMAKDTKRCLFWSLTPNTEFEYFHYYLGYQLDWFLSELSWVYMLHKLKILTEKNLFYFPQSYKAA